MKRVQKRNYCQNRKIFRMTYLKVSKTQNNPQNIQTFKISCKQASNEKKISKQTSQKLELKNIKNGIFDNIKNSKITLKTPKRQNSKIQKDM